MIINRVSQAEAEHLRNLINGTTPRKVSRPKPGKRQYCDIPKVPPSSVVAEYENGTKYCLTIPVGWDPAMYNTSRLASYTKEAFVKAHRAAVISAFWIHMRSFMTNEAERARVVAMEFLRYGPGDFDAKDNLRAACKYMVDATCACVLHGDQVEANIKRIGRADGALEKRGVDWTYAQQRWPGNKALHGARVTLITKGMP